MNARARRVTRYQGECYAAEDHTALFRIGRGPDAAMQRREHPVWPAGVTRK